MRAGRLQTRRYRVRRNRRRALLALSAVGLGIYFLVRSGWLPLPGTGRLSLTPAATASPADTASAVGTLTLTGQRWYALSLGAFDDPSDAAQTADSFRARGAGGFVLTGDSRDVLAAAYSARTDALTVQRQLKTAHGVDTALREIAWPEVTLRLSGQKAQIDALTDACAALEQLPGQLSALAQGMDRQTVSAPDARAVLLSHRDTLRALTNRLDACFDSAAPAAVQHLRSGLSALSDAMDASSSLQGSARLGGQVKYCHLSALSLLQSFSSLLAP